MTARRRPRLVVYDYGSGNLRSAERALARAGATVSVTGDATAALAADGLVVPGVGAFAACMTGLRAIDGDRVIRRRVEAGRPLLGVCVGMQVLFANGAEHGLVTEGVSVFDTPVTRLAAPVLPHMGWNTVQAPTGAHCSALLAGIGADERFYFVHSYAAKQVAADRVGWAEHGERFVATVEAGCVSATQFHPEKSGEVGAALLGNWLGSL